VFYQLPAGLVPGYYVRSAKVLQQEREIEIVVGRTESNLVQYVRHLAEPLLEVFESTALTDREYETIVQSQLDPS